MGDLLHEDDKPLFDGFAGRPRYESRRTSVYRKTKVRILELASLADCFSVRDVLLKWAPLYGHKGIADRLGLSETTIRMWCSQLDVHVQPKNSRWINAWGRGFRDHQTRAS